MVSKQMQSESQWIQDDLIGLICIIVLLAVRKPALHEILVVP